MRTETLKKLHQARFKGAVETAEFIGRAIGWGEVAKAEKFEKSFNQDIKRLNELELRIANLESEK